jgi:hypothetical protein
MIPVKMDSPMVQCTSRWDYFKKAIPIWRNDIVGKTMYPICFILAVIFFLWSMPFLSVVCFAGTGFFYYQHIWASEWLQLGSRKVMMAK